MTDETQAPEPTVTVKRRRRRTMLSPDVPSESVTQRVDAKQRESRRIPMSIPRPKLTAPTLPGHHLHWINDDDNRINDALQGGYVFVESDEVLLNSFSTATDTSVSGNTDLGTRVSLFVGTTRSGQPMRAYLMKIKQEWYDQDQAIIQERSDRIDQTLKAGKLGIEKADAQDASKTYVRSDFQPNFNRRP